MLLHRKLITGLAAVVVSLTGSTLADNGTMLSGSLLLWSRRGWRMRWQCRHAIVGSAIRSLTELDPRFSTHNGNREATRQTKFAEVRRCSGCFQRMSCVAGNSQRDGWINILCGGFARQGGGSRCQYFACAAVLGMCIFSKFPGVAIANM